MTRRRATYVSTDAGVLLATPRFDPLRPRLRKRWTVCLRAGNMRATSTSGDGLSGSLYCRCLEAGSAAWSGPRAAWPCCISSLTWMLISLEERRNTFRRCSGLFRCIQRPRALRLRVVYPLTAPSVAISTVCHEEKPKPAQGTSLRLVLSEYDHVLASEAPAVSWHTRRAPQSLSRQQTVPVHTTMTATACSCNLVEVLQT